MAYQGAIEKPGILGETESAKSPDLLFMHIRRQINLHHRIIFFGAAVFYGL